jgi:hypothetical protein
MQGLLFLDTVKKPFDPSTTAKWISQFLTDVGFELEINNKQLEELLPTFQKHLQDLGNDGLDLQTAEACTVAYFWKKITTSLFSLDKLYPTSSFRMETQMCEWLSQLNDSSSSSYIQDQFHQNLIPSLSVDIWVKKLLIKICNHLCPTLPDHFLDKLIQDYYQSQNQKSV